MRLINNILNIFGLGKKKVFISYKHSTDSNYRSMLHAWNSNERFDFNFEQCSPSVAIDSKNESKIKKELVPLISNADYLLVIIGQKTHLSKWVAWEIKQAKRLGLKLIAVKINNSFITPKQLLNSGTEFARSFKKDAILDALERA